jgi:flagellar basal-body rod modification protein FlgD
VEQKMATSGIIPTTSSTTATSSTASTTGIDANTIAGNFTTFLSLLTTQLQNQDPLSPMDTNQFTQQLVEFAQVEQQLKSNDQLGTLVSLQQTAQNTAALDFVGKNVAVAGANAPLTNGTATWNLSAPKPGTATINIANSAGQNVYSTTQSLNSGTQPFTWNGQDLTGAQWPDGNYTLTISAQDANGQTMTVPTGIEAAVDSADLTQSPPVLSIAGQNYTLDKIQRVYQ